MNDFVKQAHRLGIFFVIWFALCVAWYYIQPAERELHVRFFRLSFLYFYKMNVMSMISGAVQAYFWGYLAAGTWILASKLACVKK